MALFTQVEAAEAAHIRGKRCASGLPDSAPTFGLALSGGGIRSATFSIGALQALAKKGVLRSIDYISAVSGGGFAAAWLCAWVAREDSVLSVEQSLREPTNDGAEVPQVAALRSYSNYLTPKLDLLGPDPWTFISAYLLNLIANLAPIVPLLSFLVLTPMVVFVADRDLTDAVRLPVAVAMGTLFLLAVTFGIVLRQQRRIADTEVFVHPMGIFCAYVGSLLACQYWASNNTLPKQPFDLGTLEWLDHQLAPYFYPTFLSIVMAVLFAFYYYRRTATVFLRARQKYVRLLPLAPTLAAILTAALTAWLLLPWLLQYVYSVVVFSAPRDLIVFTLAPAVGLLTLAMMVVGFTTVIGRHLSEVSREWIHWLLGRMLLAGVAGTALTTISIWAPYFVERVQGRLPAFSWTVLVGLVLLLGGPITGGFTGANKAMERWLNAITRVSSWVLCAAALIAVARWNFLILSENSGVVGDYWTRIQAVLQPSIIGLWLITIVLAWLWSMRTGNNRFSMHSFYRNRLVRCYLRPSNAGDAFRPDRLTDFSEGDDLPLRSLTYEQGYNGPYLLLSCSLNSLMGEELAWQERKASSFVFAPLYTGFQMRKEIRRPGFGIGGFSPTCSYVGGSVTLGMAAAISGAAISPYMGHQSSRTLAFSLSILNLRLGWWLPNPCLEESRQVQPRNRLLILLKELFGVTSDTSEYVYISDGGHFENLGIYELVHRRCRRIIAIDGGADPRLNCEHLANAIEKCRVDLGVDVDIDPEDLRTGRPDRRCWIEGTVRYSRANQGEDGILLYIKASMSKEAPYDVLAYSQGHSSFPHEGTRNQWFTERQFESYRALGELLTSQAIAKSSIFSG